MIKNICLSLSLLLLFTHAYAENWEHLFDNPKYQNVKISPDGKHLAVAMDTNGKRSLAFLNRKNMKYVGGAKLPDNNEVGEYFWANNERVVIKISRQEPWDRESKFTGELYAINVNGSDGRMIHGYSSLIADRPSQRSGKFKKKKQIKGWANVINTLPDNKNDILISSTPWDELGEKTEDNGLSSVYKLNIYNGKINKKRIAKSPIPYATFLSDNRGELKAVYGIDKNNSTQLYFRKDKKWQHISSENFGGYFHPVAINNGGTHLLAIDNFNQDIAGLFKMDLSDGSYKNIFTDEKVDITDVEVTKDNNNIYALRVDDGFPAYLMTNQSFREAQVFKGLVGAFPNQEMNITSKSKDDKLFIVAVSSDIEAGRFYLYDSEDNKLSTLLSYFPQIKPDQLAYKDPFSFTATDGTPISGYFTEAKYLKEGEKAPLVVLVHGGPNSRDYWGYSSQTQYLALNGYSVLEVNFRGSTGFGVKFKKSGYLQWGTTIQQDIKEAYQWAIDSGKAEKGKSCIMGASFGAYSAITSVINYPDTYQCAIANAGIYDLELMYEEANKPQQFFGGSDLENSLGKYHGKLKAMSPVNHTDKIEVPLFLAHAKQDRGAPFEHVERLKEALDKSNKKYNWYVMANENNGFYVPENQKKYMKQVISFLDQHL
ncbi:MAG: S9 family peptidase [Colwellia sp.]|nr:S9 family peptidase [Colwellia sp.]